MRIDEFDFRFPFVVATGGKKPGVKTALCCRFQHEGYGPGFRRCIKKGVAMAAFKADQRFFAEVLSGGFRCCRAIELSQFLWGRDNPWFDRLRRLPPGATVGPELFR